MWYGNILYSYEPLHFDKSFNTIYSLCILDELDDAQQQAKKSVEEVRLLQTQLFDSQRNAKDSSDRVTSLQGKLVIISLLLNGRKIVN